MARDQRTASELVPDHGGLPTLREAAGTCDACHLYENATQTVFGEGTRNAEMMLIGEQPGDREDIEGAPFVGPAGGLLDRALLEAGIERDKVYVTNIVKHFKFEMRGKRRIHKKPNMQEITACKPWFDAEVDAVQPRVVVAMGATAAKALLGSDFRVTRHRGEFLQPDGDGPVVMATVHPSAILRAPDDATRRAERAAFVKDLAKAARRLTEEARL